MTDKQLTAGIAGEQLAFNFVAARPMSLLDIPLILYLELSAKLGMGDEIAKGSDERLRLLCSASRLVGFQGFIGFTSRFGDVHEFTLYFQQPALHEEDEFGDPRCLSILVRSFSTGAWAFGRGELMRDSCTAWLHSSSLDLESPALQLASLILLRASQLARDPRCHADQFWEVERSPNRTYTNP